MAMSSSAERGAIIGARIKECRETAGLTREQVASAAGMPLPDYARLEQGHGPFAAGRVLAIAEALGVTIGLFLGPLNVEG